MAKNRILVRDKQIKCKCAPVLIVDDEPFNLIALEGLLHMELLEGIDKAYNGRQALNMILSNQSGSCGSMNHCSYKVVITDNNMPVMNGIEFAEEVRKE